MMNKAKELRRHQWKMENYCMRGKTFDINVSLDKALHALSGTNIVSDLPDLILFEYL